MIEWTHIMKTHHITQTDKDQMRKNERGFRSFLFSSVNNHLLLGPHETNGDCGAETAIIMRIIHGSRWERKKKTMSLTILMCLLSQRVTQEKRKIFWKIVRVRCIIFTRLMCDSYVVITEINESYTLGLHDGDSHLM